MNLDLTALGQIASRTRYPLSEVRLALGAIGETPPLTLNGIEYFRTDAIRKAEDWLENYHREQDQES